LIVAARERVLLPWRQNRTLSGGQILLQEFMVTIASASLWPNLELQREQQLAEARAIQIRMLPQGFVANRKAKRCDWNAATR
jgi:hypothetical protein